VIAIVESATMKFTAAETAIMVSASHGAMESATMESASYAAMESASSETAASMETATTTKAATHAASVAATTAAAAATRQRHGWRNQADRRNCQQRDNRVTQHNHPPLERSLPTTTLLVGGNRFGESPITSTNVSLNSARPA
jgi:hypothetical protein